jgi:hypothetical protein
MPLSIPPSQIARGQRRLADKWRRRPQGAIIESAGDVGKESGLVVSSGSGTIRPEDNLPPIFGWIKQIDVVPKLAIDRILFFVTEVVVKPGAFTFPYNAVAIWRIRVLPGVSYLGLDLDVPSSSSSDGLVITRSDGVWPLVNFPATPSLLLPNMIGTFDVDGGAESFTIIGVQGNELFLNDPGVTGGVTGVTTRIPQQVRIVFQVYLDESFHYATATFGFGFQFLNFTWMAVGRK